MPLRARVKHWHGVAIWKWKVKEDDCGICRQPFDGTCPDCSMPGDDCPPVWGVCTHHFHMHCIMKWLQQQRAQDRCPLCRAQWEIKLNDEPMSARRENANPPNNQLPPQQQQQQQQQRQGQRARPRRALPLLNDMQ